MSDVRVKHCGITSVADAELCAEAGAWALGMILWRGSARECTLEEAGRITSTMRRRVELAGVFVNAPLQRVIELTDALGLTIVQLHGDEGPSYCAAVSRRTGAKVCKASRVSDRGDVAALEPFHTDQHLLDGGGGETFVWDLVRERRSHVPLLVAGGLTAANVADAIAATDPYGVDVASGTESAPGVKDPERVAAVAAAVARVNEERAAAVAAEAAAMLAEEARTT
jgi:phosphoribosylanthranilate isomerase